jgi:hypothetical protein
LYLFHNAATTAEMMNDIRFNGELRRTEREAIISYTVSQHSLDKE